MNAKSMKSPKGKDAKPGAFDIEAPLPPEIAERALTSGGYPYDEELKKKVYSEELTQLQLELLKLQSYVEEKRQRYVVLFEGRAMRAQWPCPSRPRPSAASGTSSAT
jgi:polyphosphate kinase